MGIMGDIIRRDLIGKSRMQDDVDIMSFENFYYYVRDHYTSTDGSEIMIHHIDRMITVVLSGRYGGVRYEVSSYCGMYPLARVLYGEGEPENDCRAYIDAIMGR